MKKYSSAAAVILITSSSTSSDATRQADITADVGQEEHIIGASSTVTAKKTVAPVYAGYCMGCDNNYWKRINNDDYGIDLRSVSVAIKKLGQVVVAQNRSTYEHKRSKGSSENVALIDPSTTTNSAIDRNTPHYDANENSLATEERLPPLNKYPPLMMEENDTYFSTPSQQPAGSSTLTTGLAVHNMVTGTDSNDDVTRLYQENELLKERLELLREIELREKIDLLRIGLSNALNENGLTASSPSSSSNSMMSSSEEEESHILMEQVLISMLKSNEEREKQLFYQMTLTISLVGSLVVALVYIHNSQGKGQKEQEVTTEGLTDLIIPAMCPASPTESLGLGSITEEGDTALSKHSLREENKILRNQLELMRAIGPNGVIHEDQEYDGSVLSDASISVDQDRRWWRFGIRPQPRQQRPIVKGLDRVKADAAASSEVSNQFDTAPAGVTDDGGSSVVQPQPRWGWGRRKTDEDVSSKDKSSSSSTGDEASDDDRSQVSLSSMGISASIDYQLKMMSENC